MNTDATGPFYQYDILTYNPTQETLYGVLMPRASDRVQMTADIQALIVVERDNNWAEGSCTRF